MLLPLERMMWRTVIPIPPSSGGGGSSSTQTKIPKKTLQTLTYIKSLKITSQIVYTFVKCFDIKSNIIKKLEEYFIIQGLILKDTTINIDINSKILKEYSIEVPASASTVAKTLNTIAYVNDIIKLIKISGENYDN